MQKPRRCRHRAPRDNCHASNPPPIPTHSRSCRGGQRRSLACPRPGGALAAILVIPGNRGEALSAAVRKIAAGTAGILPFRFGRESVYAAVAGGFALVQPFDECLRIIPGYLHDRRIVIVQVELASRASPVASMNFLNWPNVTSVLPIWKALTLAMCRGVSFPAAAASVRFQSTFGNPWAFPGAGFLHTLVYIVLHQASAWVELFREWKSTAHCVSQAIMEGVF